MAGEMTEKPATIAFVALLSGDDNHCEVVVELAEHLHKAASPCQLVVAVLPAVPESRRSVLFSHGCIVLDLEVEPVHLAMADFVAKLRISELVEYERLVYLNPGDDDEARIIPTLRFADKAPWPTTKLGLPLPPPPPPLHFNADTFVLEPSLVVTAKDMLEALRMSPATVAHHQDFLNMLFKDQYKPIPLEEKLALSMLTNKASNCPLAEKKLPPFSSWLATTKEVIFARKNLPAMATMAASSAAAGVVTSAANPAICFGFYAVFIAAIAFVTISLREI